MTPRQIKIALVKYTMSLALLYLIIYSRGPAQLRQYCVPPSQVARQVAGTQVTTLFTVTPLTHTAFCRAVSTFGTVRQTYTILKGVVGPDRAIPCMTIIVTAVLIAILKTTKLSLGLLWFTVRQTYTILKGVNGPDRAISCLTIIVTAVLIAILKTTKLSLGLLWFITMKLSYGLLWFITTKLSLDLLWFITTKLSLDLLWFITTKLSLGLLWFITFPVRALFFMIEG